MEKKLVEHLIQSGIVSRKDIHRCVLRAAMSDNSVVDELVERIKIDTAELAEKMAEYWGLSVWRDPRLRANRRSLDILDAERAEKYGALPLEADIREETITMAVYDVEKAQPAIEKVRQLTGISPTLVVCPRELLIREIYRHYRGPAEDPTPSGPIVEQGSRREPIAAALHRKAARPGSSNSLTERGSRDDDPAPTRQVDLTEDNPFLDLITETGRREREDQPTQAILGDIDDFFEDIDGFEFEMPTSEVRTPSAPSNTSTPPSRPVRRVLPDVEDEVNVFSSDPSIGGALEAFDAELSESVKEPAISPHSSIDWGVADKGGFLERESTGAESRSLRGNSTRDPYDVEGSGIFPLESESRGSLGGLDSESVQELTLQEMVGRQRKQIERLQREVEYQKGVLQTMAEFLIEARVMSRRKLKNRLKALKTEQKKKVE